MASFGHAGTDYSKLMYKAFEGQSAGRTSAAEKNYLKGNDIINKMNDPFLNVGFEREHYGGVKIKCAGTQEGQNMQFQEDWTHAGGTQTLPDGTQCSWCGGTRNSYSGSSIGTCIGPSDAITSGNHSVTRSGNGDNQEMAKSGAPMHAGSNYHESGNDTMGLNGGKNIQVSGRSKYGGLVGAGSHGHSADCGGKADYGHGTSVHNGDEWQSVICQMGDGSVYIAVGQVQAASAPKGVYTLQIDKGGNMTIKTAGAINVESGGTHTIKAPHVVIDSEVMVTKHLEASEYLKAPFCHSCADKAKGSC